MLCTVLLFYALKHKSEYLIPKEERDCRTKNDERPEGDVRVEVELLEGETSENKDKTENVREPEHHRGQFPCTQKNTERNAEKNIAGADPFSFTDNPLHAEESATDKNREEGKHLILHAKQHAANRNNQ